MNFRVGDLVETKIGQHLATIITIWPLHEEARIYIHSRDKEYVVSYRRIKKL